MATPVRCVRVDDETWHAARRIASQRGEALGDVLRRCLASYIKRHTPKQQTN